MAWRVRLSAVLVASLAACAAEPTELVVVVGSDLRAPMELDEVDIRVSNEVAMTQTATLSLSGVGSGTLPATLGVRPEHDDAATITVTATGLLAHGEVVHQTVHTRFVPHRRLMLPLYLAGGCRGVACGPDETCSGRSCRAQGIDPTTLPPFDGTIPDATAPSDAGSPSDLGAPDAGRDMPMSMPDTGSPDAGGGGLGDACSSTMPCAVAFTCCMGACNASCGSASCTTDADCAAGHVCCSFVCTMAGACM